jgi:hypothetical protein
MFIINKRHNSIEKSYHRTGLFIHLTYRPEGEGGDRVENANSCKIIYKYTYITHRPVFMQL